jgi:hypothetical protein
MNFAYGSTIPGSSYYGAARDAGDDEQGGGEGSGGTPGITSSASGNGENTLKGVAKKLRKLVERRVETEEVEEFLEGLSSEALQSELTDFSQQVSRRNKVDINDSF